MILKSPVFQQKHSYPCVLDEYIYRFAKLVVVLITPSMLFHFNWKSTNTTKTKYATFADGFVCSKVYNTCRHIPEFISIPEHT